jgi:hypothetical protein
MSHGWPNYFGNGMRKIGRFACFQGVDRGNEGAGDHCELFMGTRVIVEFQSPFSELYEAYD